MSISPPHRSKAAHAGGEGGGARRGFSLPPPHFSLPRAKAESQAIAIHCGRSGGAVRTAGRSSHPPRDASLSGKARPPPLVACGWSLDLAVHLVPTLSSLFRLFKNGIPAANCSLAIPVPMRNLSHASPQRRREVASSSDPKVAFQERIGNRLQTMILCTV